MTITARPAPVPTLFPPAQQSLRKVSAHWYLTKDGDANARALYRRHYSCYHYRDGRQPVLFCGPGQKMVLIDAAGAALFIWRKFIDACKGQHGVNNACFRNESPALSSLLIEEAVHIAWERWPGERLYTYVNGAKVRSSNPGCCFLKAGWRKAGHTAGGLLIFERLVKDGTRQ